MTPYKDEKSEIFSRLVSNGARLVSMDELLRAGVIVWTIKSGAQISEKCISLMELMGSACRNARNVTKIIERINVNTGDDDLIAALKKYVEDACQALKEIDSILKKGESGLTNLFPEIPNKSDNGVSWRNLIGRRDVIAHNLLSLDNERVYDEAKRDFIQLKRLLSYIDFAPTMNIEGGEMSCSLAVKGDFFRSLEPIEQLDQGFQIGNSLILVYENSDGTFSWLRIGRSTKNTLLLASDNQQKIHFAFN